MSLAEALAVENRRKALLTLAKLKGAASFSEIQRNSGIPASTLMHHLNVLQRLGLVKGLARGAYELEYKTPWCYLVEATNVPFAYMGLLGERNSRRVSETTTALSLLREKEKLSPERIVVLTSYKAVGEWREVKAEWILVNDEELIDIDLLRARAEPILKELLRRFIVILDCTSATKPATIAYYSMAVDYHIPLIYVYENTGELKWLISKNDLKNRLGV